MNIEIKDEEKLYIDVPDVNYIPGYKIAEAERRDNELIRIANEDKRIRFAEDLEQKVESGYFDGKNGRNGTDGINGVSATINGVNTLNMVAGENVDIQQEGETLTINAVDTIYDDTEITKELGNLEDKKADKNNTYTKDEIDSKVAALKTLELRKVESLPEAGENQVLYLVPKVQKEKDIYDEYIYVDNNWEHIGTTEIDLSDYATKEELPKKISDLENDRNFVNESFVNDSIKSALGTINIQLAELTHLEEVQ